MASNSNIKEGTHRSLKKNEWGLTECQTRFVEEYVSNGYLAKAAYIVAYNSSASVADSNAYAIMKKPEAQRYMQHLQKDRIAAQGITAERVLEELATMAFAQKGDEHYNASAKLKALDLLQKQMGLQKQQIKAEVEQNQEIRLTIEDND